jgi:23S rRNA G2069 N7-methylase RlmK/C1962 C5-methylase RlmI
MNATIVSMATVSFTGYLFRVFSAARGSHSPFYSTVVCLGFEWLAKLAKRGEKFDIVILDPPSSSVSNKKRWSVKNDMDELVALAAPLVKKGGMLWTTTNSASLSPIKFARSCKKGFDSVGLSSAYLERVQPMPIDFHSIGPQPVKNLVWRLP